MMVNCNTKNTFDYTLQDYLGQWSTLTGTKMPLQINGTFKSPPQSTPMCDKKELATTTKLTIDAMVQAGESDEFMSIVLFLAKIQNKTPMEVYAGMTDTWNEVQDYLDESEEEDSE